jgi:predicted nucleic acid-binding protein
MNDRVFVDTNVFIYARDDRFPEKQGRALDWLREITRRGIGVISPQIIGEIHSVASKGRLKGSEVESHLATEVIAPWCKGQTDLDLIQAAWTLRERTRFQWWDCVILASAISSGCRFLLSEDYQHDRTIDGVTIINPFKTSPADVLAAH